jgi:hypothetical protein
VTDRFARLFRTLTKADLLILDDWGPGPVHRQPTARPDGNRRGPLWRRLDADHQPAPRGGVAWPPSSGRVKTDKSDPLSVHDDRLGVLTSIAIA